MAWICTVNDDYRRLVEYVNAAKAALPGSDWENDAAFMGEWTVPQAFTAFLLGETQTGFSLGQQALDQLPFLSDFVRKVNYILLAEPTGMTRTFLDHGLSLIRLLRQAEHAYASRLLAAVEPETERAPVTTPGVLGEALNEREIEVLRLFAAGLTNATIASRLFVSLNTVQWYAKNLYRKLDVHSRSEAISKGYELNLLS
jgi:ATP/maltotriose-dependent transcriptional regulator MalT